MGVLLHGCACIWLVDEVTDVDDPQIASARAAQCAAMCSFLYVCVDVCVCLCVCVSLCVHVLVCIEYASEQACTLYGPCQHADR